MTEGSRPEPFLGLWGWLVAVGLALVAVARLISLFSNINDMSNEDVAPALFSTLGSLLAALALAAAGLFSKSSPGLRVALLLGGCYFLLGSGGLASLFGLFA